MKTIWIVRKHPPVWLGRGHIAAFYIHGQYRNRAEAKAEADLKNKRSIFLYTVYGLKVKELT
jgi:hypothetical protein